MTKKKKKPLPKNAIKKPKTYEEPEVYPFEKQPQRSTTDRTVVLATPTFEEKFLEVRAEQLKKVKLAHFSKKDSEYLMNILLEIYNAYKDTLPDEPPENLKAGWTKKYSPKMMFDNVMRYFQITFAHEQPISVVGMSMFLGISKSVIFNMKKDMLMGRLDPQYHFIIDCLDFCEMFNEHSVHARQNPAGPIFLLKNYGWKDTVDLEINNNLGHMSEEERAAQQANIANFSEKK